MRFLLKLFRAAFWRVVGPPPRPQGGTITYGGAGLGLVKIMPPNPMAEAERLLDVAREYEQRTGRPLFGSEN